MVSVEHALETSETLLASTNTTLDSDGDGISDLAESISLTNPDAWDSDFDGYSDIEELARGLNPGVFDQMVANNDRAVGISATADGSLVTVDVSIYLPDSDFTGLSLDFGVFVPITPGGGPDAVQLAFPPDLTFGNGTVAFAHGREPGSLLIHFDVVLPQSVFEAYGWLPLYATLGPIGSAPTAAAAQTIIYEGEALIAVRPVEVQAGFATTSQVGGLTNRPIEPGPEIPTSMTANELCIQTTSPLGATGGLLEVAVTTADCVEADFLYCSSNCGASAGTTRTIVDPLALIGG